MHSRLKIQHMYTVEPFPLLQHIGIANSSKSVNIELVITFLSIEIVKVISMNQYQWSNLTPAANGGFRIMQHCQLLDLFESKA